MTKKATIKNIGSGYQSGTTIDSNFDAINDKLDNTISRDGSTPNNMTADLDLDGNDLLNVGDVTTNTLTINGVEFLPNNATSIPDWEGAWTTATSYVLNDMVSNDGSTYICVESHTSGTFSTDLAASKWELFAQKGSTGPGTGDMLAANNLSDVANTDTSLTNLGGGTVGIAIFKDTTSAEVRTEIDAQQQNDVLDDLSGLTQATNKVPYFDSATTASTLDFVDEDDMVSDSATAIPSQQSVKAYVDAVPTGGWKVIGTEEIVTDKNSVSFNNLSGKGYRSLKLSGVLQIDNAVSAEIQVREASGTWRTIGTTSTAAGANNVVGFDFTVYNVDGSAASSIVYCVGHSNTINAVMDRSDNTASSSTTGTTSIGYHSYNEPLYAIRIYSATGFEGSTSDQRGVVILEAI